jgi:hypothetical protein
VNIQAPTLYVLFATTLLHKIITHTIHILTQTKTITMDSSIQCHKRKRDQDDEEDDEQIEQDDSSEQINSSSSNTVTSALELEPFIMSPNQEVVVQQQIISTQLYGCAINASDGGSGKTSMTSEAVHRKNLDMLVIGLGGTLETTWTESAKRQRVRNMYQYCSWDMLCGSRPNGTDEDSVQGVSFEVILKHPWLRRYDTWTGAWKDSYSKRKGQRLKTRVKVYHTEYRVTPALLAAVDLGLAIVGDEIQKAKNNCLKQSAFATLISPIFRDGTLRRKILSPGKNGSCVFLLSATIIDNVEQAIQLLKSLGIFPHNMKQAFIYDRRTCTYEPSCNSVIRFMEACKTLNLDKYREVERKTLHNNYDGFIFVNKKTGHVMKYGSSTLGENGAIKQQMTSKDRPNWFCYMLLTNIINPIISGCVRERFDFDPDVRLDFRNVVYLLKKDNQSLFNSLSEDLKRAIGSNQSPDVIASIRRKLEELKQHLFISQPLKILISNLKSKVFIVLNFIESIHVVARALAPYGVGVIMGSTPPKERQRVLNLFQAPTNQVRVVISQMAAGTAGIDLHDVTSEWNRHAFISPCGRAIDMIQGMKRIKRKGVKGDVFVNIVYGGNGGESKADEATMMLNLMKKSLTLKGMAPIQVENGVPLPSDLPIYREVSDNVFKLQELDELLKQANPSSPHDEDDEEDENEEDDFIPTPRSTQMVSSFSSSSSTHSSQWSPSASVPIFTPPLSQIITKITISAQLANSYACLSNDWPSGASPQALRAVQFKFGLINDLSRIGFNLHGKHYSTVTHFVHSSLAPPSLMEQIRLCATPKQVRDLFPLPSAQGGINSPAVRRLILEALRAKFSQDNYAIMVLQSIDSKSYLVSEDSNIECPSLLQMVKKSIQTTTELSKIAAAPSLFNNLSSSTASSN